MIAVQEGGDSPIGRDHHLDFRGWLGAVGVEPGLGQSGCQSWEEMWQIALLGPDVRFVRSY
ncbi:MAG TPA: hypothetical protein VMS74_10885 [Acidimicrobiia bacterium]|nr:hypothetical protein [Acidimicrobiia bacterium]